LYWHIDVKCGILDLSVDVTYTKLSKIQLMATRNVPTRGRGLQPSPPSRHQKHYDYPIHWLSATLCGPPTDRGTRTDIACYPSPTKSYPPSSLVIILVAPILSFRNRALSPHRHARSRMAQVARRTRYALGLWVGAQLEDR
jgi:hypothetical protein